MGAGGERVGRGAGLSQSRLVFVEILIFARQ
jgi:hypothetical protein